MVDPSQKNQLEECLAILGFRIERSVGVPACDSPTLEHDGWSLSSDQLNRFAAFEDALYETNKVMNLTRVPREESWLRHFVDSLLFHDLMPSDAGVLDIGSGPGLPAWPLANARPDLRVTALDSSMKMISFLQKHSLENLKPVLSRAEEWGVRGAFDVVTGRAVAPFPIQMELSTAPAKTGGLIIPMRTQSDLEAIKNFEAEILGLRLVEVVERVLPVIDAPRVFPVYEKMRATPERYPRPWAEMKRRPL